MSAPARRILLVDDEPNVLSALRRTLRREGYELFTANGPAEALELLKKQPVDMVISDHLMPEQTGLELLKMVRNRHPDPMRIMLTGHADIQTAIEAINHGEIYRFLTKPWDDVELKVTLTLAFEYYDVQMENRRLLTLVRRQQHLLDSIEEEHPGITHVQRDSDGAILLEA